MHDKNLRELGTTSQAAFSQMNGPDRNKTVLGKKRQLIEAELMKRAVNDLKEPPIDRSAQEWRSINHSDFSTDVKLCLDIQPVSEEITAKYQHPITFWSDHAKKGCGTVICSTKFAGAVDDVTATNEEGIRFGKHAAFSTPIQEFNKGPVKDV
ncbi:hypothetical protein HDU82_005620 [Entophlyctis luteolus]|nr:hypothetical protein HDU82_005620 [Entophlyctis luteolus]